MASLRLSPCERRSSPAPADHRDATQTQAHLRREIGFTGLGIVVTVVAALLSFAAVAMRTWSDSGMTWPHRLAGVFFLVIVAYLVYGSLIYQLCRLAYLKRLALHRRAPDDEPRALDREIHAPSVTVLVPSYKEEVSVVKKTLLSAALQGYPRRRVVLLIDDPPEPTSPLDRASLSAMRRLPEEIEDALREPRRQCAASFAAFRERLASGHADPAQERRRLSRLYREIGVWFETRAAKHSITDHVDKLFVELAYRGQARRCFIRSEELDCGPAPIHLDVEAFCTAYRSLAGIFDVSVSSFERKRYANLSHASNKAMNLNSYLGLMGRVFREVATSEGDLYLEESEGLRADLSVPDGDYVLMVDADSILHPDYTTRLIHFMEEPGHETIAVAQTPYNAFPNPAGALERIAGATTDIQYIIHQGFTHYAATFWVGANALVRKRALEDIAVDDVERGHPIRKFIQDRTVIEDTESTVDLIDRGWTLYNYPERLAFSATPPDFGSLIIQRRRWANGGLIILPKLIRYLRRSSIRSRIAEGMMRGHYLTSLAVVNASLLVVLALPLGDGLQTLWLPLTAVPYYALYTRDLVMNGYRASDALRVYALNLLLIPVNLVGTYKSLRQAWTGRQSSFGRTPKTQVRTRAPRSYLVTEYMLLMQWLIGAAVELLHGRPLHATLAFVNAVFLAYAILTFIGFPDFGALDFGLARFLAASASRVRSSLSASSWLGVRRT